MSIKSNALLASSALVLSLAASPAFADGMARGGWYAGLLAGAAWPDDLDVTTVDTLDSETGFAFGGVVGKNITGNIRAELEISYWSADGDTGCTGKCLVTELDVDALTILGNAWLDIPAGHDLTPYVGGGIGFGSVGLDGSGIDDTSSGFAWQLGVGLRFDVSPNMTLDVGYRYKTVYADGDDFGLPAGDVDPSAHIAQVGVIFAL